MPTPDHNATLDKFCRECAEALYEVTRKGAPGDMESLRALYSEMDQLIAKTVRRCIAQSPEVGAALRALEAITDARASQIRRSRGDEEHRDNLLSAALAGLRKLVEGDK